jgi:O-acetylserine/cysteine efflux transporter
MSPRHVVLAVLVAALWGFNFVVIAVGVESFPPLFLSALRFAFAAVPMIFFVGRPKVAWRWILAIGLVLGIVKFSFLFVGIDVGMPAGLASVVLQSQAFFTALLSAALLSDRPRPVQLAGMAIAFCGMGVIATDLGVGSSLLGFALVVAAAAMWGLANVLMKQAAAEDMLNLMVWVSVVPPIPMLLISLLFEGPQAIGAAASSLDWLGVGSVLYLAYVSTILGFGIWGFLLRVYSANLVAPFSLLVPVFGMASSAVLLGETFDPLSLLGAVLVIVGLVLTVYRRKTAATIPTAGSS